MSISSRAGFALVAFVSVMVGLVAGAAFAPAGPFSRLLVAGTVVGVGLVVGYVVALRRTLRGPAPGTPW